MAKAPIECLHSGDLYIPSDPEVMNEQLRCLDKLAELNSTKPSDLARREELCKEIFAEFGEGSYVELPFHSNFGGKHCHLGKYVYLNFNCTLTDDTHIYIGDYTMFGPNCVIATAGHPIDPDLRRQGSYTGTPVCEGQDRSRPPVIRSILTFADRGTSITSLYISERTAGSAQASS